MDAPPAIYYQVEGPEAGEPVVLLNGGLMSAFAWEPVAASLRQEYRLVRLDFRGQLMSLAAGAPPPDLSGHAADVVGVLDKLGIGKAHVVGTSFGALVGLVLAAEHPERIRSLIAMTATAQISPEGVAGTQNLRRLAREAAAGGDGGKLLDTIVPTTYSPEWIAQNAEVLKTRRVQVAGLPAAWFSGIDGLLASLEIADPSKILAKITCPTTIVKAERDVTFPPPSSEELAAGIAGARLVTVPGASHGLALEHPAETAAIIREAIAGLAKP
jgi:pimeloyl-ACP methyl ester carboxylesterase